MFVQTVITETLTACKQETELCDSCSRHLKETLNSNNEHCYYPSIYKAMDNWHKGICKEHEYHQTCLDRRFRHK